MKCHNTECLGEAKAGSNFCEKCRPSRSVPENIEAAQVRVAKATEEKDKLYDEIRRKHGAISDLDRDCQTDRFAKKGGPKDLRRRYNEACKELRLAKSDLERMRNEEQQRVTAEKIRNAPCPACDRIKDGPMCKACGPVNDYKEFKNKAAGIAERCEAEMAKGKEWTVEAKAVPGGVELTGVPEDLKDEIGNAGEAKVVEVKPNGDTVIEISPERKKGAAQIMEENAQKAESKKATKQVDLNGEDLKLPLGVKETKKVSRSRVYEITDYKITVKEDDLLNFNHWPSFKQRTFVARKLRFDPDEEDAIYDGEEHDDAIDEMNRILVRAAFILAVEREREAILLQRLAEVA